MRGLEQFLITVGLAILGAFLLGVIGFFMGLGTRRRLRDLEQSVAWLRGEVGGMSTALQRAGLRPDGSWAAAPPPASPWAAPAAPERAVPPQEGVTPAAQPAPSSPPSEPPQPALAFPAALPAGPEPAHPDAPAPEAAPALPSASPATPPRSFEETIALRWGVWLGAAALLLAGVFLIRYAVEEGLLGPAARCIGAALLGFALIAAGEWLARRPLPANLGALKPDHAPPALTAGGVAALFGAAYGAAVMYALVPPSVGFVLMALAGGAGLVLSIRRGPLVAAVGLAAAFATPALVQTANPSLPGLYVYLLVVTVACMGVVRVTAAGWLGWCAAVGDAIWVLAGSLSGQEPWAPALFVPLAASAYLFLLPREALDQTLGRRLAFIPFAALGLALLPETHLSLDLANPAGILLLSLVGIVRARGEPRLAILPFVAAGLGLLALFAWHLLKFEPTGERVVIEGVVQAIFPGRFAPEAITPFLVLSALLGGVHFLAGLAEERRAARPLPWAALAATVPVLALLIAYARVRGFAIDMGWAFAALALAGLLTGTATLAAKEGSGQRAGTHAAGAMAALALAFAMVLRDQWLTLAISLLLPPLAWLSGRAQLPALRPVALAVAAVVLIRLLLNRYVLDYGFGETPLLNGLWVAYAVPAASFAVTSWLLRRERDDQYVAAFEAAAALLGALFVLLQIRHGVHAGKPFGPDWVFAERALDAAALSLIAVALHVVAHRWARPVLGIATKVAAVGALGLGVLLLVLNPWTERAVVGAWPVANLLLPAYLVPAVAAAWAVLRAPELQADQRWRRVFGIYALAAVFAWVTFQVWALFHDGGNSRPSRVYKGEFWAYSAAWLVLGGALFWLGVKRASRELRLAALAVLAITSFKVFLVDMGALVGLMRVFSFLGLGLSLIGLGAVYRRYVLPKSTPPPAVPPQDTRSSRRRP